MKKLFKFVFYLILLVILGISFYVGYLKFFVKIHNIQAFNAVPSNAFLVVETSDLWKAYDKITSTDLWRHLLTTEYFKDIDNDFKQIDKYLHSTPLPKDFFQNRKLIIALATVGRTWDLVYIADLKDIAKAKDQIQPLLNQIPDYKTFKITYSPDKKHTYTVYKLVYLKNQYQKIYLSITENLLIISQNRNLLQKSLQALSQKYWENDTNFLQINKLETNGKLFKILINFKQLDDFVRTFQTKISPTIELFSNGLNYAILNLDIHDNIIDLKGYTQVDTNSTYLYSFSQLKPAIVSSYRIMTSQTAANFMLNFQDYSLFYQQIMTQYQKNSPKDYENLQKNIDRIEKLFGININDDLLSWIGNEVALYKLTPQQNEKLQDAVITIETKDPELAKEKLTKIFKKIKKVTPISFKSINYKGFEISYLKIKGLFNLLFGKYFKDIDLPYYTFINGFVVFSNSPTVLERVIDDYITNNTLQNDEKFYNFYTEFEQKANISTFIIIPNMFRTIYFYAPTTVQQKLKQNKELLTGFSFLGLQIINKNDKLKLLVKVQYDPGVKIDLQIRQIEQQANIQELISQIDSLKFKIQLPDSLLQNNGQVTIYFPNSQQIQYQGQVQDGHPVGLWRAYYQDGNLKMTQLFDMDGTLTGTVQFFYDNKANTKLAEFPIDKDLITGNVIIYYPNGAKRAEIQYKNNIKDGTVTYYYPDGSIQIIGHYKKGQKHGKWLYYDKQGNLISKEFWKNGRRKR